MEEEIKEIEKPYWRVMYIDNQGKKHLAYIKHKEDMDFVNIEYIVLVQEYID